jgi:hypothetical protein
MFASSPADLHQLMLAREAREVRHRLREALLRDGFALETRWAVRMRDFINEVLYEDPDIVHLSGHGNERGEWLFEDDGGLSAPASINDIEAHFKTLKGKIKAVFFNGCYSDSLARAVTSSVDCAVGIRNRIDDSVAVEFSSDFYGALASDRSILTSFEHACNMAKTDRCEPMIYFRDDVIGKTLRLLPSVHDGKATQLTYGVPKPGSAGATSSSSGSIPPAANEEVALIEGKCTLLVGNTAILFVPLGSDNNPIYYRANPQQVALRRIDENQVVLLTHPQPRDTRGNPLPTRFQLLVGKAMEFRIHFFLGDRPCLHHFQLCRTATSQFNLTVTSKIL